MKIKFPAFLIMALLFSCNKRSDVIGNVDLASSEMKAVLEKKEELKAEQVEVNFPHEVSKNFDSITPRSIQISFVNSTVNIKDRKEVAYHGEDLVTVLLQYDKYPLQFEGYEIRFINRKRSWFGLVNDDTWEGISFDKSALERMKKELTDPENILPALADRFYRIGDYESTILICDSLIKLGIKPCNGHLMKVFALLNLKDTVAAVKEADLVYKMEDTTAQTWIGLARFYQELNMVKKEESCLKRSLDFDSGNAEIYYSLAVMADERNETDKACEMYRIAKYLGYVVPVIKLMMCDNLEKASK